MTDYPDFEGGKQKVYLMPEWAAKEAADKQLAAAEDNKTFEQVTGVTYTVPTGKSLYLNLITASCVANLVASGDLPQHFVVLVNDNTAATNLLRVGGNGGVAVPIPKPLVIPAGHQVGVYIYNYANHAVNQGVNAYGYEV